MLRDLARAVADLRDPRLWGVVVKSMLLTLGLLAVGFAGLGALLGVDDLVFDLPLLGVVDFGALGVFAYVVAAMFGSALLTPLVAALFIGLLLDDVVDAVEDRRYPDAGPARAVPALTQMGAATRLLLTMIAANLLGLLIYLIAAPLAPVTFLLINGYLIGREYFETVALRRVDGRAAKALRRRNRLASTVIGAAVAGLLAVPLANLVAPLLGVAAATHLFHRVAR